MINVYQIESHLGKCPFFFGDIETAKRNIPPEYSQRSVGIVEAGERYIIEEIGIPEFEDANAFRFLSFKEQLEVLKQNVKRYWLTFTKPSE
jgi:hypothetical protein